MGFETRAIGSGELSSALHLLEAEYARQRSAAPVLPVALMGSRPAAAEALAASLAGDAVGAFAGGELVAFMGVSATFPFKGLNAALIGEFAHAGDPRRHPGVFGALYAALGAMPGLRGCQLHLAAHFPAAGGLTEELYRLGFGAFLAEQVRGLSPVAGAPESLRPVPVTDLEDLVGLEMEHRGYYRRPPICLWKDGSRESVRRTLQQWRDTGTAVFAHADRGRPLGYFAVAACEGLDQGRILRHTGSAQVVSAYVSPGARGKGVGRSLLGACVAWARERGYQRLMVEHETANLLGAAFWGRHFQPYLYFSMRYLEREPAGSAP